MFRLTCEVTTVCNFLTKSSWKLPFGRRALLVFVPVFQCVMVSTLCLCETQIGKGVKLFRFPACRSQIPNTQE